MSSEQNQKDFDEFLSGSSVKPPTGSVFDDLNLGGGPPMVRLILLQVAFGFLTKLKSVKNVHKALLIGLVCCIFLARDLNAFVSNRNPNIYSLIGAHRTSDSEFIQERLDLAKACEIQMDEESCAPFAHVIQRLDATQIQDLKFVLIERPNLRELYDKTETFIRKKQEKSIYNPSQGNRYLSAFTDMTSFSIFIIMMSLYVEKHQNFAKQMVIVSLLLFASINFQLKAPKEGEEENSVIQLVNKIPALNSFTYFELSYIVKSIIYPIVFQAALFMSRMIDLDPLIQIRETLQNAQRALSRSIVTCELITDINQTYQQPVENQEPQPVDENNQLNQLEENQPDQLEAIQKENLNSLGQFGKADAHVLRAYKWVCEMRQTDTIAYMKNRIEKSRSEEQNISFIGKIGRLIKKLFILAIVGLVVGPTLYKTFAPQLGIDITQAPDTVQTKTPKTQEDFAKAAQEREQKDQERQRQKQQEFDNIYDGNNQDL